MLLVSQVETPLRTHHFCTGLPTFGGTICLTYVPRPCFSGITTQLSNPRAGRPFLAADLPPRGEQGCRRGLATAILWHSPPRG